MKKVFLILGLIVVVSFSTLYSQRFCETFGGSGTDYGYDILATADGGFVVAGTTDSYGAGGIDFYIVKFDMFGNSEWNTTVGDFSNELAYGIAVATNGDYIITGETNSLGTGGEMYVVRLNASGNLLWTRSIGGSGFDFAKEITPTSDNGCAIIGTTGSYGQGSDDVYVVKLDSAGLLEWSVPIGTVDTEGGYGIQATSDGNIIIAGRCFPGGFGGAQIFVTKYNYSGGTIWSKYFTSHDANDFFVPSDIVEANGGYIISGYCDTVFGTNKNSFLTKISTSGSHQWTRIIGIGGNDNGYGMEKTNDGGFIISGNYYGGTANAFVVKTDSSGVPIWYAKSTSPGNSYSYAVTQLNNGSYISAGYTDAVDALADIFIIQIDSAGGTCCGKYVSFSSGLLACTSGNFGTISSGGIVDTGGFAGTGGIGLFSCISPLGMENIEPENLIKLYPNPANREVTINGLEEFDYISITNLFGRIIYEDVLTTEEIKICLMLYPKGFYFVNLRSKEKLITKKLLIE